VEAATALPPRIHLGDFRPERHHDPLAMDLALVDALRAIGGDGHHWQ
jgi:hypothetical protein